MDMPLMNKKFSREDKRERCEEADGISGKTMGLRNGTNQRNN